MLKPTSLPTDKYWPSEEEPELLGKYIVGKVADYRETTTVNEILSKQAQAYRTYFGFNSMGQHATSGMLSGGEQGELAEVRVNHARALVNTLVNLVASAKTVWDAKATNNDWDSVGQCILAASLLEYYWQDRQVAKYSVQALEQAVAFTEGFLFVEWDDAAGEEFVPGAPSGDIKYTNFSSWDVIRDSRKKSYDELEWIILRRPLNKWNLAAKHAQPRMGADEAQANPQDAEAELQAVEDLRQEIITQPQDLTFGGVMGGSFDNHAGDSDDIFVYHFFHKKTPALPEGLEVMVLPNGKPLYVQPLQYETIPLYRVSSGELIGTPYGYGPFLEIMGIQEYMDSLHSSVASNQLAFATQNITAPAGSEIPVDQLAGGLRLITYPQGSEPPKALQLLATPQEVFLNLKNLKGDMEQIFGVNDVVRGNPEGSTRSGKALALLQSQAVQQASALQQSYLRFVESVGMATLQLLQTRATVERRVSITGKNNRYLETTKNFTKDSIAKVNKVQVQAGNPLSQTAAGREQLADKYGNAGFIKTPEQLEQVLSTGRIEPLTQGIQTELMLISAENEKLQQGINPPVWLQDDALLHASCHKVVASNPEAREDPKVMQAWTEHMHGHYRVQFGVPDPLTDVLYRPRMLFMLGQGAEPIAGPPMPGQGGPQPQSPPKGPQDEGGGPSQPPPPQGNQGPQSDFPTNPSTGKTWDPTQGFEGNPPQQ